MTAAAFFEKRSKPFWVIVGIVLVIVLGMIDYLSGDEISISLFYLIPIFLVVWYIDGRTGLVFSFASTVASFVAKFYAGQIYSHPSIYIWNAILRLGFYCVVSWLVWMLKRTYKINQELARTDYVTGAVSVRYFYELAKIETSRARRYGHLFTLAYIDLDNFKTVNDHFGHSTGDKVLRAVTDSICRQVRPADTLGRLGGDEFALLMPETDGDAARAVIDRIHSSLVDEMLKNDWMVTFSVGVVTYTEVPKTVDEMVKIADDAMYSVKTASKNGVYYCVYNGEMTVQLPLIN